MAKKTYVLREVQDRNYYGNEVWRILWEKEDGTLHVYDFPKETLEWRAAEYGIDPDDRDTLLDIVLHEPFIDEKNDAAAAAGFMSKVPAGMRGAGQMAPTTLHNASSIDEARQAHLLRIQDVKDRVIDLGLEAAQIGAKGKAGANPLDQIKQNSPMRPEYVEAKREWVSARRASLRIKPEPVLSEIDKLVMKRKEA